MLRNDRAKQPNHQVSNTEIMRHNFNNKLKKYLSRQQAGGGRIRVGTWEHWWKEVDSGGEISAETLHD